MATVDPYASCPCGSGQKFKWCCHKAEPFAERAERLLQGGQVDASLTALDEGLRKFPDNAWLLIRKALTLAHKEQTAQARPLLQQVLASHPGHLGAHGLLVRIVLETEGPEAGAAQLQQALSACGTDDRPALALSAHLVGMIFSEAGHAPAARAHLELAQRLLPEDDPMIASALRMVESNPTLSPWLRNPDTLAPVPDGLSTDLRDRFEQALTWADQGLWASAASAFETLAADDVIEAERNLGLCRLWMADDPAAVASLRRYIRGQGATTEAVDLEALCQLITPPSGDDLVEHVHKIWNLKNRDELLAALRASNLADFEGTGPLDPDDPQSFQVDQFALLDRPKPELAAIRGPGDVPRILGRVLVGGGIVILDTYDDGRLDPLLERFTDLAGTAIPPAHPKTKLIDRVPRTAVTLRSEWWLPPGIDRPTAARLEREERARMLREVWPDTPLPALHGRSPRRAAQDGGFEVPLRAAVSQLELAGDGDGPDFSGLRDELGIPEEPPVDPESVDIDGLHLGRLHLVPADRLDDDRLARLWQRARRAALARALERAARAILERPGLLERPDVDRVAVFSDLANLALGRGETAAAHDWLARGRRDEPGASRSRNAPRWDMVEVRLRARTEPPEAWVPALAVVLERYGDDRASNTVVLSTLVEMGLVQMVPNPDNPEQIMLDSRPLTAILTRYGPKITTATGELGVSAAKGGLWTPGSPTGGGGGGGGLWTPSGSTPPAGADKPKLIIPGR